MLHFRDINRSISAEHSRYIKPTKNDRPGVARPTGHDPGPAFGQAWSASAGAGAADAAGEDAGPAGAAGEDAGAATGAVALRRPRFLGASAAALTAGAGLAAGFGVLGAEAFLARGVRVDAALDAFASDATAAFGAAAALGAAALRPRAGAFAAFAAAAPLPDLAAAPRGFFAAGAVFTPVDDESVAAFAAAAVRALGGRPRLRFGSADAAAALPLAAAADFFALRAFGAAAFAGAAFFAAALRATGARTAFAEDAAAGLRPRVGAPDAAAAASSRFSDFRESNTRPIIAGRSFERMDVPFACDAMICAVRSRR